MHPIRKFQRSLAFVLVLIMAVSSLSCYNRFRIKNSRLAKIADLKDLTFILMSNPIVNSWTMVNPSFEKEGLNTQVQKMSQVDAMEIQGIIKYAEMRKHKNKVLIYVNPTVTKAIQEGGVFQIDYKDILKIEVFERDVGKTIGKVLLVLGITAGVALVILLIACNCPSVYAENPDSTPFEGVLYSGAIYPSLERHDWLPMPQLKRNGFGYQVRLSNEINEVQHTNQLELLSIDHPLGVTPMFDKYGHLLTLSNLEAPVSATNLSGLDVLPFIFETDGLLLQGEGDQTRSKANDGVLLRFKKPANAKSAKLVIKARNTVWLQQTFGAFQDEMGDYQALITDKYRKKSSAAIQKWMNDQQLPLSVWVETKAGKWEKLDYFNPPGPTAFRQDVLQLDIANIPGDELRIKLESGFMFWEIDWIAIDYSQEIPVQIQALLPTAATDNNGLDQTKALLADDGLYYHQPQIGDQATIVFPAPDPTLGLERSLILHGKGYYDLLHKAPPGKPNVFFLRQFERPNALPKYSRALWNTSRSTAAN